LKTLGRALRLALGHLRELPFECLSEAGMKRVSRLTKRRAISRVLHERLV
jgi:hypothetical protein